MDDLGPKIPHRFTELFFFTQSDFSMNKDLDGHDTSFTEGKRVLTAAKNAATGAGYLFSLFYQTN
jgi:hypothetical protein